MRRILHATTAIVASVSLLAPTFAVAQQAPDEPAKLVKPADAPTSDGAQPQVPDENRDNPQSDAASPAAADAPQAPAQPDALTEPAPPAEKPAEVEVTAPEVKPADAPARAERMQQQAEDAQNPPADKPDHADAASPDGSPTPKAKPKAAADAGALMEQDAPVLADPVSADPAQPKPKPAQQANDPAPQAKPAHDAGAAAPQARQDADAPAEATQAEKRPLTAEPAPARQKTAPLAADTPPPTDQPAQPDVADQSPAALKQALEKAVSGQQDADELAAPEAQATETEAARAAANPEKPAENAALKAAADAAAGDQPDAPKGRVEDFTVTQGDARRSDEDFATSVARSVDAPAKEAGKDDHRGRDLARLALVGAAGFVVGNMLSNNREVALNTGDRVVVTLPDGSQQLIKDDDALLFRPGSNVQTERYEDGSTITTVIREDGSRVVTIRDAGMNIQRRSVVWPDGRSTSLIDDTTDVAPVRVSDLPPPARPIDYSGQMSEDDLRAALLRESNVERHFTLGQIRNIAQVRALVAPLDIRSITFDTGSAAITPNQAEQLSALGRVIADSIRRNPNELYLIEGYTDAIGSEASNLALSDRRAESVALALTEYFHVPPENMVVQGYGEQFLRIQTPEAERANRRVAVRRITDLIEQN